ncbi:MAG: tubulin-like doman-containing protein [Tannerella sp.]|jgi:hypothetical protein|nr:tubulin-like doman-containing protein [Tannerella sp.]
MANHLIIGLGGTGGKILREMRKRVYEEYRSNNPPGKTFLEYLYVDSDPSDLASKEGWETMGGSVHLMPSQKVSIHGIGANVLDNLYHYPGIHSFINDEDRGLLNDIGALVTAGIGGQRRRLGRLLFANNLSGLPDARFTVRLQANVHKIVTASKNELVTFHVCAGLAGGTGSGSIVDTIAQIRKIYGPEHGGGDKYKLHLYLYVPEIILVNPTSDSGYYHANGYAALSELNAMSLGAYRPYDVSGLSKDKEGHVKRLLQGCEAFEVAYLFSNINEANHQLELQTELPAAVADFLFQKIITAENNKEGKMKRLVGCENDGAGPEKDGAGIPVHSRRFLTFGVKRVEYPETEVKEYVTYSFARQAARQLQFNLWRDGIGFDECSMDEVGIGFKTEIQEKKTREDLLLSDNYLTLSKSLIDNVATKRWKEIASGWETSTQFFAEDAMADKEKKNWLSAFTDACELHFNTNYRGQGVKDFYKVQRGEKKAYAACIRRHIEEKLFNEWHSGSKSILEVEKYIALLIEDCESRLPQFKEKIASHENIIEHETAPEINRCNNEWNHIGWLRDAITNASTKVFSAYKTAKCEFYTLQTRIEGNRYAIELLQAVKNELEQMQNSVVAFRILLTEMLRHVQDLAEAKCKSEKSDREDSAKTVKKYDPEQVRETTRHFITDENRQKHNASQIRGELVGLLGENGKRSFNGLLEKLDMTSAENIFFNVCITNATAMMEDLATADSTQRMLNVNILEKIKQEYNSDERLEEFVTDLVKSAKSYLQFNPEEIGKRPETSMMQMIQLSLPKYDDPSNFRQKFIDMFAQVSGIDVNQDVSENDRANRIVIVAAASGFPLRFVSNVANLKDRYDEKMAGAALSRMVVHTESHKKALPELFEESVADKKERLLPVALTAFAMQLPVDKTNPTTGETFKAIGFVDELGMVGNWVYLGKNVLQAVDKLTASDVDAGKVIKLVEDKLRTDYLHNEKKAILKKSLAELINTQVLALCGNNDMDTRFMACKNAAVHIIQTELAEK